MAIKIYAKHKPYTDGHLDKVSDDMALCGAPTIRCVEFEKELFALEGSHRLFLAHRNNLIPKVFVFEPEIDLGVEFYRQVRRILPFYEFEHIFRIEEKMFMEKEL